MLTVFSADLLDLIYRHNVVPTESPFAAMRVSVPTLNLLIIVIPNFTNYKIYYCDTCPTMGQRLYSKLRPIISNPTLTQVLSPSQNHLVVHTVKQLNNPPPKSHHLNSLIKNHNYKKPRNTNTQSILQPNLQIDLVLLDNPPPPPPLYHAISNPVAPIKVKLKYIKREHNNNINPTT